MKGTDFRKMNELVIGSVSVQSKNSVVFAVFLEAEEKIFRGKNPEKICWVWVMLPFSPDTDVNIRCQLWRQHARRSKHTHTGTWLLIHTYLTILITCTSCVSFLLHTFTCMSPPCTNTYCHTHTYPTGIDMADAAPESLTHQLQTTAGLTDILPNNL